MHKVFLGITFLYHLKEEQAILRLLYLKIHSRSCKSYSKVKLSFQGRRTSFKFISYFYIEDRALLFDSLLLIVLTLPFVTIQLLP